MTTKSGQPTNENGQKPKIKPCRDVVIEQSFELETLHTEVERLRNLLVEIARALGLDAGDIDDLPQKAASLKWDYDEAMRQYDEAQKRACEAEEKLARETQAHTQLLTEAEWAKQEQAIEAEQQREQTR